jgi:hypothetical protein
MSRDLYSGITWRKITLNRCKNYSVLPHKATINKKQILIDRSKEVGLEINTEKNKYLNMHQFNYLEITVTKQNLIMKDIMSRLNSGNACYHPVQILLFSWLLSKNVNISIYRTVILPVVLYWSKTWSLLGSKDRLTVFKNSLLREMFEMNRDKVTAGENCIMRSILHQV